jgi:hypothetical protein
MSTTHRITAALAGLALSACAHANTAPSTASSSYLGGQAGQPGSWNVSAESAAIEQRRQQTWNEPGLGGRSAQPSSWTSTDVEVPASPAPSYCYLGGRDAQPSSGPALLREHKRTAPTAVCELETTPSTRSL